ncbi:MAG TPA: glycosyltransferase family 4 protein [Ferruginibacter sp.]|nr:glycosyltransferase family 4 protein [Ferruginibacter sp.]HMP20102.1 glycosyltransferase family 4 protein [Ferruginibacter sp.]
MYKILRIHNRLIVGGPSHNVTLLSAFLSPEFETKLLVGKKDRFEKDATYIAERLGLTPVEIPEMRRSILPFNDIIAYFRIRKIIRQYKPDIVHTHASKAGAIGRLAARAEGVKLVVHTFHGHVFHSYFNKFISGIIVRVERFLARKTDAIIAISDSQKTELSEVYKIAPAHKVFTIPLGFNLDKFSVDQEIKRKIFRNKYGFGKNELLIGIIGRIVPIKNHDMFLEVAAIIKERANIVVRFAIIGDGESRQMVEKKAGELGLSYSYFITHPQQQTDVVVTSWETEIDQALAGLDIVLLTSHNEGTPVSLIEAQAASRPVVCTNVGGVEDAVIHGETGYITQPGDVQTFANYVFELIEDASLREQMGYKGHDYVTRLYSRQRLVGDMKKLYLSFFEQKMHNRVPATATIVSE